MGGIGASVREPARGWLLLYRMSKGPSVRWVTILACGTC